MHSSYWSNSCGYITHNATHPQTVWRFRCAVLYTANVAASPKEQLTTVDHSGPRPVLSPSFMEIRSVVFV